MFAFLLASFPARNSDIWKHLAIGRDVAHGQLTLDNPSFVETVAGSNWLYDFLSYGVYSVADGAGLVVGKALLVVGVGLILLRLSWTKLGWWVPVGCTALALLAMGTRLLLQPETISLLLLALTLLLLRRNDAAKRTVPPLPPWPLAILFAVWANVDAGFVVGLGVVALVWLGETLDEAGVRTRNFLHRTVALAGLATVCLLNPAHVHVFTWPAELSWSGSAGAGLGQVMSPFGQAYLTRFGHSPAGLAYFPLLGLGLLSFALTVRRWRWQRSLPWVGLAVLSVVQARAVPVFAVVAGPVLAWNLQDIFVRRSEIRGRWTGGWLLTGRLLTASLGLAVLACAWTGWLRWPPFEPRRWAVETAPALERCARTALRWHQDGRLGPHSRALHLSPDTASAFAWFCPQDRGILSARLVPSDRTPEQWAGRMREAGITHAVVYDTNRDRLFAALEQFLADPGQWPLLYLEGDVAVFGWRDPARAGTVDPYRGWEVDPNQLAFHPAAEKVVDRGPPDPEVRPRRWWEALWKPAPMRSIDADEADLHLLHADVLRGSAPVRHLSAWEAAQTTALIGAAGSWTGPGSLLDAQLRLTLLLPPATEQDRSAAGSPLTARVRAAFQRFNFQRDDVPPAVLYLAIRSARRALAANPDDAQTHLVLGTSYLRMIQATRERAWVRRMPELMQLRCAQASAALNRAVALQPGLAAAHRDLSLLYMELGYLDLAAKHFRAYLDRAREAGPRRGEAGEPFRQRLARAGEELARMDRAVSEQEKVYAKEATGARILDRARLAGRLGLTGKARDELLASDVAAFGVEGMALELELLAMTGRTQDVRQWMVPEQELSLGTRDFRWLRALASAAAGDYATADDDLAALEGVQAGAGSIGPRQAIALTIGKAILDDRPGEWPSFANLGWRVFARAELGSRVRSNAQALSQRADVATLRGLLALEVGAVGEAAVSFRLALAYWDAETRSGLDFSGRVIAQDCLNWLR
ncbi:MAG TPA: hypothetical protein VFG68_01670 [Fimbriiglobus sp.]|nr:hypothetical protein [Fimbriiglobus sp.]